MEGRSGACLDCSSWAGTLDRPGYYAGPQVKHDKSFPKPKMAKHPNFRLIVFWAGRRMVMDGLLGQNGSGTKLGCASN